LNKELFFQQARENKKVQLVGPLYEEVSNPKPWPTLFVDGGLNFTDQFPGEACWSVGDGDSTRGEQPSELLPRVKNVSDLAHALSILPSELEFIELHGFSGKRLDHFLINIGELNKHIEQNQEQVALMDKNLLVLGPGVHRLNLTGTFSLMGLRTTHVTITGKCSYPLNSPTELPVLSSLCLSNEACGTVEIGSDQTIFLYSVPLLSWELLTYNRVHGPR
jgi:thiamine pyrophosphokinase